MKTCLFLSLRKFYILCANNVVLTLNILSVYAVFYFKLPMCSHSLPTVNILSVDKMWSLIIRVFKVTLLSYLEHSQVFFSLRKAVYSTCIPWTSWLFVVFLLWTSWMFPLFSYLEHPERYGDPAIQSVLTELEKGDADIDRALVLTETCQKVSKLERAIYILNVKLVCLKRELLFFF